MRPLYRMELYTTDAYYIKRIQDGEISCFACLLDKYSQIVYSLIVKVVQNKEDAEELTQDVFMKVFKKLDSFKGESSFSTWIYRIAYNTAISHTRKKKQELLAIEESVINNVSEEEVVSLLNREDNDWQIERLEFAIRQLSPEERGVISLFYMQQKSIEEITEITGMTISNVKTKLHRIRKKLFVLIRKMEEKEYDPSEQRYIG